MKKMSLYTYFFLLVISIFCVYYIYTFINTGDFDEKSNIFLYDKIKNLNEDINTFINPKFKVCLSWGDAKTYLYNTGNQVIELQNITEDFYEQGEKSYISKFGSKVKELGKDFIYIEPPTKAVFCEKVLNKYSYTVNTKGYKFFLKKLEDKNIDCLDSYNLLKQISQENNVNPEDLYYKYDVHWNLDAGYYFTKKLVDHINEKYNYNLNSNILNSDNFTKDTYYKIDKGYYTKLLKVNNKYYDDFTYYLPKFKTCFSVYNKSVNYGSMEEVIYNIDEVYDKDEKSRYLNIVSGTDDLVQIINENAENDKKILIVGNSFIKGIVPFLAPLVKEIDIIDLREANGNYNNSLLSYIKESNPNLVIYLTRLNSVLDYERLTK